MALMDEFREERERLKHGSLKDKIKYFWYYYKFHTLVTLVCLILLVGFIYNSATQKEYVFNAAFVNAGSLTESDEFKELTAKALNIDTDKYTLSVENSIYIDKENPDSEANYYSIQKLSVLLMTYDVDITIMDSETQRSYSYADSYSDLRQILSAKQIAKYEPYFYYIDYSVCEELRELQSEGKAYEKEFPDPTKPEEMQNPVPVGIYIDDAKLLGEYYLFEKHSVLGIPAGTKHLESALTFLDFVFSKNEF